MIDFEHIEKYQENNRIEAKRSLGGLPKSMWETYSAFANTFGGIILLGVVELKDKSFQTVNLPAPEKLIEEFWEIIEDTQRVSKNILSRWDVAVHEIDGNRVISITVPRADRKSKPIYIGTNPYSGTYRRDGEGDYHCTEEEIRMMLRDREERTQDEKILFHREAEVFDHETIRRYRSYLNDIYPDQDWDKCEDDEVLCRIGAGRYGEDGRLHPTVAGLMMFGFEDEIVKEYPYFFLDYQERNGEGSLGERIVSNSGKWSGNLFDFYLKISGKIVRGLPCDIHKAVREAVANCMVNGDYAGTGGLSVIKKKDEICITNPGSFRIDIQEAIDGGKSDPRNAGIAGLFNRVKVGTHTGKGVPDMYEVWQRKGWKAPQIQERLKPDRITLKLPLYKDNDPEEKENNIAGKQEYREKIIDYVTRMIHVDGKTAGKLLGISENEAKKLLGKMKETGILSLMEDGETYHLKI